MSELANGFQVSIYGKSAQRNQFDFENKNEHFEHLNRHRYSFKLLRWVNILLTLTGN